MNLTSRILSAGIFLTILISCNQRANQSNENQSTKKEEVHAKDILGNPDYLAISYGGYRLNSRDSVAQPTILQLKEDMKILYAMGVRILRTYNVQLRHPHASNILKAISELKEEDTSFEMYVMLGAWIDCKNAWTDQTPDHEVEAEQNEGEIGRAVKLANEYPDIVKVIAVGNEAMVRWATSYYVQPSVILKWVNHLQNLKQTGKLAKDLWITSSDDFASWGGADPSYHTEDLENLIKAVDYVSMHTYPYHNSHYNPEFWLVPEEEELFSDIEKANAAMIRARDFAISHYKAVSEYVRTIAPEKSIHIGETGWASISNGHYGVNGSKATDEYKQGLYYNHMREWTNASGISCFYFEVFNENWKDSHNPKGSENHFGLFTIDGRAKYPMWDLVDQGIFNGLTRNGNPITKTYGGKIDSLQNDVLVPPTHYEPAY